MPRSVFPALPTRLAAVRTGRTAGPTRRPNSPAGITTEGQIAVPLAASSSGGSSLLPFVFIVLIFAAMYFLFIRPQQRRARETQAMQSQLGPGDEVMTGSGIYGTVTEVDTDAGTVGLEIAPEVVVTIARGAVSRVITQAERETEDEESEDEAQTEEEPDYETDSSDNPVIERKD